MTAFGYPVNYTKATDFTNPADVGNAVAYAMIPFMANDGWNQDGLIDVKRVVLE